MSFKGKEVINPAKQCREKERKQTKGLVSRRSPVIRVSVSSVSVVMGLKSLTVWLRTGNRVQAAIRTPSRSSAGKRGQEINYQTERKTELKQDFSGGRVVPPSSQSIHFGTPSECLKRQVVSNPIYEYTMFFL